LGESTLHRKRLTSLTESTPDGHYEVRSFAVDEATMWPRTASFAPHTEDGGPVPPTGKRVEADYVYVMQFDGDRIRHMTKIWNDEESLRQLGWA
jgi:hypothetical protein